MKWTIGDTEVFRIVELEDAGKPIQAGIKDATAENLKKIDWLYPDFVDKENNFKSCVASFLIKSEKNILIDTCNGNDKVRRDLPEWGQLHTEFLERLHTTGVDNAQIDIVVNTHLHCDHVGWNTKLENGIWKPTFPNAKYLFVDKEYEYWVQKPEKEVSDDKDAFEDSVKPIVDAGLAEFIPSDYQIDENVRLVPSPGHTPWHVGVMIESQNKKAFISGDILHHPCQILHPEWSSAYDTLPDVAIETRRNIYKQLADADILFIGSHFPNPVAGRITHQNGDYIFIGSSVD